MKAVCLAIILSSQFAFAIPKHQPKADPCKVLAVKLAGEDLKQIYDPKLSLAELTASKGSGDYRYVVNLFLGNEFWEYYDVTFEGGSCERGSAFVRKIEN